MKKQKKETLKNPDRKAGEARRGTDIESIKQAVLDHLNFSQTRLPEIATPNDWYMALAYAVRDRMVDHWIRSVQTLKDPKSKIVGYLSAEFLVGPHLGNALINLGIYDNTREAIAQLGINLDDLITQEREPGLGNGGLGRLAACYMDSLASIGVPAIGYGIRYEFGIFSQEIRDGWQVEMTDKWLSLGNPWEIHQPEITYPVKLGGHTESFFDEKGRFRVKWIPDRVIKGVAYDTPIPAFQKDAIGILRLWSSEAVESFDFMTFSSGDYYKAVDQKIFSETISKVLYPNDEPEIGRALRLAQQYFFVSCSLQDMIHIHLFVEKDLDTFHKKFSLQLNDTHPSIAVAELMRLLIDEYVMEWDRAWDITKNALAYTNHTLLPEALEKWPLSFFGRMLPRHLEIIFEINRRFLDEVRSRHPGDDGLAARLSIIEESGEKYVRMAHIASVGSHRINGVAALHTKLLTGTVLKDFHALYPDRFLNVTNGVTPRRWIVVSNPNLSQLISSVIGDRWISRFEEEIKKIEPFADDPKFREKWRVVKHGNKIDLARLIRERTGVVIDPESLFDIQVKRIHEYKRQHLNVLHIITLYNRIKQNPLIDITPRTFIFGGKAAPGYAMAKLIIKLINAVAATINNDPNVSGRLKVVFFPDFNVTYAQRIYPAADLSEQISTAGKEASGTGNMKFSMNGALTIGTLDGANIEIREEVGPENFFLFGLTANQVEDLKGCGYIPLQYYRKNEHLREAIDQIRSGLFSPEQRDLFAPLADNLLHYDPFMLLADYQAYVDCQDQAALAFYDIERWTRMSILNVARMGKFSSDRSIREYCRNIWGVKNK
ncbi:MAG: glycogen/starch/alpha-glucan phosphorylase [Pseudomonadota bacterium]